MSETMRNQGVRQNGSSFQHDWNADAYYRRPHLRLRVLAGLLDQHELAGAQVLDIGSGPGILADLLGLGKGYVGLDQFEREFLSKGRFDLREWSWDDQAPSRLTDAGPFDVAIASGFLEYIEERAAFFSRVFEILKPGGLFFTSMVREDYWPRRSRARRGLPSRHPCWKTLTRPADMDSLARDAGFLPVAATPVTNVWKEWPHAGWSLKGRRVLSHFAELGGGPFVDQYIYELRRPSA